MRGVAEGASGSRPGAGGVPWALSSGVRAGTRPHTPRRDTRASRRNSARPSGQSHSAKAGEVRPRLPRRGG